METCTWRTGPYAPGFWDTDCKNAFMLSDGPPGYHGMKFCCYCGKPLVAEYKTEADDD